MQYLQRVTGAVCAACGQQERTLQELRTHAQRAHSSEICKTCEQSGRFFGQELPLRSVQEHSVRTCFRSRPGGCSHDLQ